MLKVLSHLKIFQCLPGKVLLGAFNKEGLLEGAFFDIVKMIYIDVKIVKHRQQKLLLMLSNNTFRYSDADFLAIKLSF